jgi:hypothetical protein
MERKKLFITYSHKDARWLNRVREQLDVLEREGLIDPFDDTRIEAGEDWYARLKQEMLEARVALFLISAPFLASPFIRHEEIPRLFRQQEASGMVLYPLLIRDCPWQEVPWLTRLQMRPKGARPLAAMRGATLDKCLADVAREIASIVRMDRQTARSFEGQSTEAQRVAASLAQQATLGDIFISYKREEQPEARKLANALEREGWSVWWDPKLRAGEHFDDVIEKALRESKCVIVMWSELSVQSRYVRDEATYALERNKLVPVTIENADLPFRFRGVHTLSLVDWDGSNTFPEFRKLTDDIRGRIGESAPHKTSDPRSSADRSQPTAQSPVKRDRYESGTPFGDTLKDGTEGPESVATPADEAHMGDIHRSHRAADYDVMSILTRSTAEGRKLIMYVLDTKRARTEVIAQKTPPPLIQELIAASNSISGTPKIGRTLFNVLVPVEIEPFFGGSTEMVIEVDGGTAGIPWELLDTNTGARDEAEPWAIRAKVVRKLRSVDFRVDPVDASAETSVLVIGEPKCPNPYPPLPGARDEASAVAERLCRPRALRREQVVALVRPEEMSFGPDALAVLGALHDRAWRIVHIAGHGEPPEIGEGIKDPRGVVLSGGTYLGAAEFGTMRIVPELVFINCCHLAARSAEQLFAPDATLPYDRPRFAATVAEALMLLGVRCVVAAGWAVDDGAAKSFATTFYDALLDGNRFIDGVTKARAAAREFGGQTWAAYQCYGNPEWRFKH